MTCPDCERLRVDHAIAREELARRIRDLEGRAYELARQRDEAVTAAGKCEAYFAALKQDLDNQRRGRDQAEALVTQMQSTIETYKRELEMTR